MSDHPNPFHKYFHGVHLSKLVESGNIKFLTEDQTLEAAVKLLSDNKILGAPVTSKAGQVLGMIDILDIVQFVILVAPDAIDMQLNAQRALETAGRAIAWKTVGEIVNESGRDPLVPLFAENPATVAIEYFAKGFHRAPLFDEKLRVVGILSQTSIVKQLAEALVHGDYKAIGERSLASLGLGLAEPVTLKSSATVLEAFNTLAAFKISALAVVDASGKLVGNFSASDLRGLYTEKFPSFNKTLKEFLEEHSPASLAPRAIYKDRSLLSLVEELQTEKVHRVWVIDADFKPIGLVSNTDLMKLLQNFTL